MSLTSIRERVFIDLLRWAPKRSFSSLIGVCARQAVPRRLRRGVYTTFAHRVGADLTEVERPLEDYPSLDAFFTRKLRPGVRPICGEADAVVAPCDGTVSEFGSVRTGELIQAKGHSYRLHALLADRTAAARLEGGTYVTIYLAPRDYHRVHFAVEGSVTGFQHIPGALFPVNVAAVTHVSALFARNERLVTYQDTTIGEVATVMVGATGVGHITVTYDAVETHARGKGREGPRVRFAAPRRVERGEELGAFHLGSTVIVLFEPGRVQLDSLERGQRVRVGQVIARRLAAEARGGAAA